jgi:hypothetical protein
MLPADAGLDRITDERQPIALGRSKSAVADRFRDPAASVERPNQCEQWVHREKRRAGMTAHEYRVPAIVQLARFEEQPGLADARLTEQDHGRRAAPGKRPDDIGTSNHRGHKGPDC